MTRRVDLLGPLERNQKQLATIRLVLTRADKQDRDIAGERPPEIKQNAEIPEMMSEAWLAQLTHLLSYWDRHQKREAETGERYDRDYARLMLADLAALLIRGVETIEKDDST